MEDRRRKLILALREALAADPLPYVVKAVADGFEAMNIRIGIGVLRQGDPTPLIESRIQQSDLAGVAVSGIGHKIGSFLTMLAQPRPRRPPPGCAGQHPRRK
jgi:hypothetical protein